MIHFDSQEKLPLELPTVQSRNKNDPPKKASKSSTNLNINPGRKKHQNKHDKWYWYDEKDIKKKYNQKILLFSIVSIVPLGETPTDSRKPLDALSWVLGEWLSVEHKYENKIKGSKHVWLNDMLVLNIYGW